MRALFEGIPLEAMNTSMTINATAPWLLALYLALAEEQGADPAKLQGTVQNDIIKEYLSRGTYMLPPAPSLRLIADVAVYCRQAVPKWNPMNVCSYHLQEAGATPEQELAFALATATAVLDEVRGQVPAEDLPEVVGRISFFVNAGIRFVTEMCKMRAFVELWDEIARERYGVDGREAPALPLRGAGQLARADRAAAREQRLPHPDRDAGGRALEEGPRPRRPAPGLERGAGAAAALGPAVVAPDAADHRLRDRPPGVRRPLRWQPGGRGTGSRR